MRGERKRSRVEVSKVEGWKLLRVSYSGVGIMVSDSGMIDVVEKRRMSSDEYD